MYIMYQRYDNFKTIKKWSELKDYFFYLVLQNTCTYTKNVRPQAWQGYFLIFINVSNAIIMLLLCSWWLIDKYFSSFRNNTLHYHVYCTCVYHFSYTILTIIFCYKKNIFIKKIKHFMNTSYIVHVVLHSYHVLSVIYEHHKGSCKNLTSK